MPLRDNTYMDQYAPVLDADPDRSRRHRYEDLADSLVKRAAYLRPADRTVFELAIRNGASHRALGRMMDVPAGTITRRLHRLVARLNDPLVIALCESQLPLPEEYRQLAIEHFLQGQSTTALADLHRLPLPTVRRMLEHVKGWYRGMTTRDNLRSRMLKRQARLAKRDGGAPVP